MKKVDEIQEFLKYFSDEEIINYLTSPEQKIELYEFVIATLCIKNDKLRNDFFYTYVNFFDNFDLKYFKNTLDNKDLKTVAILFLSKMDILSNTIKSIFTVATGYESLIKYEFNQAKTINDKVEYIKNVHIMGNKKLEDYLTGKIDDQDVLYLLHTNDDTKQIKYHCTLDKKTDKAINPSITIGVELETVNDQIEKYQNIPCLFKNFDVTIDNSVKNGLEVVSPVLHYTESDLSTLKSVCEVLKQTGFYTNDTCGGHIHIGADYLKTKQDYNMFMYLYINMEDIIYKITDKAHSQKRHSVLKYAGKVKDELLSSFDKTNQNNQDFISKLKGISKTRYRGLNLQNINKPNKNTIEFRMANGEIDFDELLANINLFAKLIQVSHDLNTLDKDDERIKIAKSICTIKDELEKLKAFLDLLFDNEELKQIYYERYITNTLVMELLNEEIKQDNEYYIALDNESKLIRTK